MYKETGSNKDRLSEGLELLIRLIKNITDNPNDEKYRSFKRVS